MDEYDVINVLEHQGVNYGMGIRGCEIVRLQNQIDILVQVLKQVIPNKSNKTIKINGKTILIPVALDCLKLFTTRQDGNYFNEDVFDW